MNALLPLVLAFLAPIDPAAGSTALDPRLGHPYQVTDRSQIEEGCFGLCACPVAIHGGLEGGFVLRPLGSEGTFQVFSVRQIKWVYPSMFGGSTRLVTGSGTWRIDGTAKLQRMDLDLSVGGAATANYSSGLVPVTVDFPALSVAIEQVGQVCFGTRFDLAAQPRPHDSPPGVPTDASGAVPEGAPTPPCSWGVLKSTFDPPR